jgi:4-diphosphocytidyl-2-C-methyl-D-erythritol kinase
LDEPGGFPAELIENQLAPAAISLCPPIADALEAVRRAGAGWAIVCGSGPTVAGIFRGPGCRTRAHEAAATLGGRYPGAGAAGAARLPVRAQSAQRR